MSDLRDVTKPSDFKRNSYQQLLWESIHGTEWQQSYAKKALKEYHFKKPNKSFSDRLTLKWLGQLPDNYVLEMDRVKSKPTATAVLAWILNLSLIAITAAMLFGIPKTATATAFMLLLTPLGLLPNIFAILTMATLVLLCWYFRKEIGSFYNTGFGWTRSVVEDDKSENLDEHSGIKVMKYVSGAENWSTWQKIGSVLLSTLAVPGLMVIFLPVAFVPAFLAVNVFILGYYLKKYHKYKDSIQASIETTRFVSIYKTILPIQIGVSVTLWLYSLSVWTGFGHILIKLGQLMTG